MLTPIPPGQKRSRPSHQCPLARPPLSGFSNIPCSAFAAGTSKRQPPADALRLIWLMPRPVPHRPAAWRGPHRQVPGRVAAARIRAMITLWQQGGKHRAEVDKLARDLR